MLALAAVAYSQPVTRAKLSSLAGRDVSRDVLARLKKLGLINTGPRMPAPGAPATYVTTPEFLSRFSLGSLRDLPDIETMEVANAHPEPADRERETLDDPVESEIDNALGWTIDGEASDGDAGASHF